MNVLMLDNYDSFTWNLYQYLCLLGAEVTVVRSQSCTLEELIQNHPSITHLVISPGPGHPTTDAGISMPALLHYAGKVPIMGICMGLQCIYTAFGGVVDSVGTIVHGKTSKVFHDQKGLFKSVSQGIQSTRYHSLAGQLRTLPDDLEIAAWSNPSAPDDPKLDPTSSIVMAARHKTFTVEGVQYHPESILSEEGKLLMANFLELKGGTWAENPKFATGSTPSGSGSGSSTSLPTILQNICRQRLLDVIQAKKTPGGSPADLLQKIRLHVAPAQLDFYQRLQQTRALGTNPVALMAEIKRASPSKGSFVTASTPTPPEIALSYALAGASTISVLTEPTWFKGTLMDMLSVRLALEHVPNRPAILRKDFILDPYQIDEARCYGADTILLIVACLTDEQLKSLFEYAKALGMEPLVEVNNTDELKRALKIGSRVIGVNNRNLHDFEVDMSTTSRMVEAIREHDPAFPSSSSGIIICALSGISSRADVERYVQEGVGAVLVGESLMKADDKPAFVQKLLGTSPKTKPARAPGPLVKICGLKTPEQALQAAQAGADFIGLIFVPKSRRYVTPARANEMIQHVRASYSTAVTNTIPIGQHTDWFAHQAAHLRSRCTHRKPLFVGVFQDESLESILDHLSQVPLDLIQLHGDESLQYAKLLPIPVIKTFHVHLDDPPASAAVALRDAFRPGFHALPLVDSQTAAQTGGTGQAFDWSLLDSVVPEPHHSSILRPLILAGGLKPENVRAAVQKVRPMVVDVSGGVEDSLTGEKDPAKIVEFIKEVEVALLN